MSLAGWPAWLGWLAGLAGVNYLGKLIIFSCCESGLLSGLAGWLAVMTGVNSLSQFMIFSYTRLTVLACWLAGLACQLPWLAGWLAGWQAGLLRWPLDACT